MTSSIIGSLVRKTYNNFRGIDLLNPDTSVDITRSPDCLNVWKSYNLSQSNIIQSRPGVKKLINLGYEDEIYSMYIYSIDTAIIHIGNKLIKWVGFPNDNLSIIELYSDMNKSKSIMFSFNNEIYVLDGINYLKFNGTEIINIQDIAYIPTTTISRNPLGGGEIYEDVNLLQSKRKNSFLADGESTEYVLDATNLDSIDKVYVNDILVTNYTTNLTFGKVIFDKAPAKPDLIGSDNILIEFTKHVTGYIDRIKKCTIARVFDNRVFFSGNLDYPNAVFHCSLNNPGYISDLDYYECGSQENPIKALIVGNNILWVLKKEDQTKDTIFYLQPSTDTDYGRIYPTSQGNVSVGCCSTGINYKDNILFFSRNGLEGINGNIAYEQSVSHKSSLIDSKLINMSNYDFCNVTEYNGYLIVAIDNCIFLADNRQTFQGVYGKEFEWYLWEIPISISCLKSYKDNLYFSDSKGNIYTFEGTNDLGKPINAYWTTPRDTFGYMNHLKKINKRGAILKVKNMQNGRIKIAEKTNKKPEWKLIKEASTNGFDYNYIDYANFSYSTGDHSYIVFRIKEKKLIDISLKIYSDNLNKPFGLETINLEAFIGGYVKRS